MEAEPGIRARPDQRALRAVAVQFFVNGAVFSSFLPRLPEIREQLGVTLGGVGLLLTLGSLGGLLGSAACGRLIERFGSRTVLLVGATGTVIALPVIGVASHPVVFLAALAMMQAFDVFSDVAMNLQGSWLGARRSTPVVNRLHGLWSVGTVAGGATATVAAGSVSLVSHLLLVSVVLAATVAWVSRGLLRSDDRVDEPAEVRNRGSMRRAGFFGVLALMAAAVEIVPSDWAALRFAEDLGQSPGRAGLAFVALTIGMVAGRFGGDAATAWLGRQAVLRTAAAVSVIGTLLAGVAPSAGASTAGFLLAGLGASVVFPGLYDLAAREPGRPGAMLGALTAGIRIGLLAFPVTVGGLAGTDALSVGQAMVLVVVPAGIGLAVLAGHAGSGPQTIEGPDPSGPSEPGRHDPNASRGGVNETGERP